MALSKLVSVHFLLSLPEPCEFLPSHCHTVFLTPATVVAIVTVLPGLLDLRVRSQICLPVPELILLKTIVLKRGDK